MCIRDRVAAHSHGDAQIGGGQDGAVVDAVSDKDGDAGLLDGEEVFHFLLREQIAVHFVHP